VSPRPTVERTVLVVDDERTIADGLRLTLESEGYAVRTAASVREALAAFAQADPHAAIVDLMLPDGDGLTLTRELKRRDPALEVVIITAYGSVRKAMEATKDAGAFYVLEKPFDPDELLGLIRNALERRRLTTENADLRRRLVEQVADSEILGSAPGIQRVMETIAAVADADANVLIIGESGTGKELVANALHEGSRRRQGPWIKINCAALPKDLIESELFGHTKGAFTGATTDKVGLLEEADGGSLLLDEITEMPPDLQAKLLRVLEERVVRRLGAAKSTTVDFRLISSTNRSPEVALKEGRLRQDLFFRINTVSINVPQLRERREDVPVLVKAFFERYRAKHGRELEGIEPDAYRRLLSYPWPGNVRELQHAIERAVLVSHGPQLVLDDFPEPLRRAAGEPGAPAAVAPSEVPAGSLEEIERASILKALETTKWNKQAAAALLGLRRPTLYSKMRKHGIPQRRP
jgi:DNA-binding NtrC family response regulator